MPEVDDGGAGGIVHAGDPFVVIGHPGIGGGLRVDMDDAQRRAVVPHRLSKMIQVGQVEERRLLLRRFSGVVLDAMAARQYQDKTHQQQPLQTHRHPGTLSVGKKRGFHEIQAVLHIVEGWS